MTIMKILRPAAASLLALALICSLGCSKPSTGTTQQAADTPDVDLSKATDIFAGAVAAPAPIPVDPAAVVAVINGTEITQGEVDTEINGFLARAGRPIPPERLAQMKAQIQPEVIESLIVKNLLRAAIDDENVQVDEDAYNEARERLSSSLQPGVSFSDHLERMGMTEAEFDEALRLDLRINSLLKDKAASAGEVTEEDVTAFYEENTERFEVPESVRAQHILISVKPSDDDETRAAAKAKAEEIRTKLLEGADFAELAQAESDCPSASRGGDLGSFVRGQMVPPFEEAAFSQEVDAVGDVVETRFGYHVIKVTEHDEPRTVPLGEARERIIQGLEARKQQEAVRDYVDSLREKADISYP